MAKVNSEEKNCNAAADFLRRLTNGQILAIGLIFMFLGIAFAVGVEKPSLTVKLLIAVVTEVGFAFFIAWVIISTVDEREKRNLSEKIARSEERLNSKLYISAILDLDLPSKVSDELFNYVVKSRFLKEYQKCRFKLEPIGSYVKMTQVFEAVFRNVDHVSNVFSPPFESYDNRISEVESEYKDNWGLRKMTVRFQGPEQEEWHDEYEVSRVNINNETLADRRSKEILPGGRVKVTIENLCSKYASDNEIFTNNSLTEVLSFEVQYDSDIFEVSYRSIHPSERIDGILEHTTDGDSVQFTHPFLPSHGFIIWWRRKDLSTPQDEPVDT
ncbi:hypothetical protein GCM10011348_17150 [Marinobacterium nitratireducens]|uniref:Uncharacterized protein n=1 Tax=Marinobacterium nitratireducens TaxID=518897 RepID=A0A917ZEM7_9GAMM|nr:hypothetical protein [Marinobacterium nitratireducens]GGO80454.1 hypothetical protein GCM10011348_17150 [Marinobacterium nitratireducens]